MSEEDWEPPERKPVFTAEIVEVFGQWAMSMHFHGGDVEMIPPPKWAEMMQCLQDFYDKAWEER